MKRDLPDPRSLAWPAEQGELALAGVEAHAGRADAAFALLECADAERDPSALLIPHDISFAGPHVDPRRPAIVARVRGETPRRRAHATTGA